ncbi:MAG: aminotransferase class V-fold PLP-dependent enzyme [Planctomycetaceae bacterium]|nr:aminotransferase class V-fold PLP-dependent enzyme [Planctomycetaceae bacterium]
MHDRSKWVWTDEEIRRVGYRVVDMIADYVGGLPERPVFRPCPEDLIARFAERPLPESGQDTDSLLEEFVDDVLSHPFGNGHPRFFGWVNSPPAIIGVFAEMLAAAMNPSVAGGNHAAVYVEHQVVRWMKELIGFPAAGSMGLLVSGSSMASLTGLAVARHVKLPGVRQLGMQEVSQHAVAYVSAEGHSCLRKALELLGFGSDNIRQIPVDDRLRMRIDELDRVIQQDRQYGHLPVVVAASAGTAGTGAIDPLRGIRDICAHHGVWFHVDAAYGGPAILSDRYRDQLAALRDADSLALDLHKWMSVPVEAGLALVKDGAAMRDAFSLVPPYIRTEGNSAGVMGLPWFSEYGMQQTRGFRALKAWMCLKYFGRDGYREQIERDLTLAEQLAGRVRQSASLELALEPGLSIVCFRYAPPELKDDAVALNHVNQQLLETVQLGGTAFLTSTLINGAFWLRACIINHRTTAADIDLLVDHIVQIAHSLPTGT